MQNVEYQFKLKNGKFLGLKNFGRQISECKKKCRIRNIDLDNAKKIAKRYNAELTKFERLPAIISNYGEGWDIECFCDSYEDAKENLKAYRENCNYGIFKLSYRWSERYIKV